MADLFSQAISKINSKKAPVTSRGRKVLQVLQVSASDENLLTSPGMMRQKEKKVLKKPSGETLKVSNDESKMMSQDESKMMSKEHLRRSKRKNVFSQNEDKEIQKEDSSSKNIKTKSSKVPKVKKAPKGKKSNEQVNLNQSNLDSYISVGSKSSEVSMPIKEEIVSERSIFTDNSIDNTVIAGEITMRVIKSTSDEADMLTCDAPDITYWKMLAEQRQKTLEVFLNENSLLQDQLDVLEVENGQLKHTLQELEKVVEIINASLE